MVAPVTRTHGVDRRAARHVETHRRYRRGESFEGQCRRREEARFATGRNHGEPQDRQQGETNLHGRRGTNRRGGAKPRGRHAGEAGCLSPKGTRRRVPGRRTLRFCTMEGRSLETPREAVRPARSDREDRDATGKSASRSGGAREACQEACRASDRRDLEGHGARASKAEEGSGEANSRGSDRKTPPVDRPPTSRCERRETVRRAKAQPLVGEGGGSSTPVAPRCGEDGGEIRHVPGDPTNHIPARRFGMSGRKVSVRHGSGAPASQDARAAPIPAYTSEGDPPREDRKSVV